MIPSVDSLPETLPPAGKVCPVCEKTGFLFGLKHGYTLFQCDCPCLLSWQWENVDAYERLYTDGTLYHNKQQRSEGQRSYWQRDTEHIAAARDRLEILHGLMGVYLRGLSLMDIGTGTCALPMMARIDYGMYAFGIEPNESMVARCEELGRPVIHGKWENLHCQEDFFFLCDSLEHFTRPVECLSHLNSLLRPDGRIWVEMPEWESPAMAKEGLAHRHVRPLQHLCLYSDRAMRSLAHKAGLMVDTFYRPLGGALGKAVWILAKA